MTSEERTERPERSGPPGDGGDRPPRGEGRPQRPRFSGRRKVCRLCADHMEGIDYKDIGRLRMYVSDRGKIEPRRKTGTCARHQRALGRLGRIEGGIDKTELHFAARQVAPRAWHALRMPVARRRTHGGAAVEIGRDPFRRGTGAGAEHFLDAVDLRAA